MHVCGSGTSRNSVSPADHRMAGSVVVDVFDCDGEKHYGTKPYGRPITAAQVEAALIKANPTYVWELAKKDTGIIYVGDQELAAGSYSFRLQKPLPSGGLSNNH